MTLAGLIAVVLGQNLSADLQTPFQVMVGGKALQLSVGHAAPWMGDLDGDGKPDLLVGQFADGIGQLMLNKGTKTKPLFNSQSILMAGEKRVSVSYG